MRSAKSISALAIGGMAALILISGSNSARAEDFTFSFMGHDQYPGTVTGIIRGLDSNGLSSPTSVSASENGTTVLFGPGKGTFTVVNGVLTAQDYQGAIGTPAGNGVTVYTSLDLGSDVNEASNFGTNGTVYNTSGFSGVTYAAVPDTVSAAPEPGTWALLLGGVGILGAMLRAGYARRREDELKSIATA